MPYLSRKFCLVLTVLFLLTTLQCTKEKTEEQPTIPQTPLTPAQLILGSWKLELSVPGKYPYDTTYYPYAGMEKIYHFQNNDTVLIDVFLNGVYDTLRSDKKHYEFSIFVDSPDTFPTINIDDFSSLYDLYNDTLILDRRPTDGNFQLFERL